MGANGAVQCRVVVAAAAAAAAEDVADVAALEGVGGRRGGEEGREVEEEDFLLLVRKGEVELRGGGGAGVRKGYACGGWVGRVCRRDDVCRFGNRNRLRRTNEQIRVVDSTNQGLRIVEDHRGGIGRPINTKQQLVALIFFSTKLILFAQSFSKIANTAEHKKRLVKANYEIQSSETVKPENDIIIAMLNHRRIDVHRGVDERRTRHNNEPCIWGKLHTH